VRGHIEAFQAQDAPRTLSFLDPHVVLDMSRMGGIDSEAFYGHEALASSCAAMPGRSRNIGMRWSD
jgi:hypothetical protein